MKRYCRPHYFLFLIFLWQCNSAKNIREQNEGSKFTFVEAVTDKSIQLKKTCRPIAYREGLEDKEAFTMAIQSKADTLQIFQTRSAGIKLFGLNSYRYDIRFWSCDLQEDESKKVIRLTEVRDEKKKETAKVVFLPFANKNNNKDYQWLSESLADAIDAAMQKQFEYIRAKNASPASENKSTVCDVEMMEQIKSRREASMLICGSFLVSDGSLQLQSVVFEFSKGKQIGKAEENTKVTGEMFSATSRLAKSIVRQIYKYEISK